jgi:hypothetical protein
VSEHKPVQFGTVEISDARHNIGYITPDTILNGIERLVFFPRNASVPEKKASGELVLKETGLTSHFPVEGERVAFEVQDHPKCAIAIKWCLECEMT